MDNKSILTGNIRELNEIKEELINQGDLKESIEHLVIEKQSLEKDIAAEEKFVEDTIATTVKKRREELVSGYDREINANNGKLKSIKNKKESAKKKAVAKRINDETKEIKRENESLHKEIRLAFKERKIPRFCDSTFYYALFCTSQTKEFIIFAFTTVFFIALVPNAICFLLIGLGLWRVLIYIGIIVVVVGLYFLVYKMTKAKDKDIFDQMRPKRTQIENNKKKIKKMKRKIKKDKNESLYDLVEFDEEVNNLRQEISELEKGKDEAVKKFEEFTVKAIADEITERSKNKIFEMKEHSRNIANMIKEMEVRQKEISLKIASDYEAYLGSEFMSVNKIEELINVLKEGKAPTIAEAMEVTKGR